MEKGYIKKPLLINLFSILYLLNPIYNLLLILFGKDGNMGANWGKFIHSLSHGNMIVWINVILWISAIPLAVGLFLVKRWAWYYFIVQSLLMILVSFSDATGYIHISRSTLVNLLVLIPLAYFLRKEIRIPYFNPRVRWWQQSNRLKHSVHLSINNHELKTYDLSPEGAFIATEKHSHFEPEKQYPAVLTYGDQKINLTVEVRWIHPTDGEYPQGIGIAFKDISNADKKSLISYIEKVQSQESNWSRKK